MFHILCLIKIRIHHASTNVHIHDGHELMMMHDIHMLLNSFNTITSDGSKYIVATFNINTQKTIHIVLKNNRIIGEIVHSKAHRSHKYVNNAWSEISNSPPTLLFIPFPVPPH
jgi:hypothetical protein